MNLEEFSYPIYRKRKNNKSFYKINSFQQFEEIQIVGKKFNYYIIEVLQYPEKLLLLDMISLKEAIYDEIKCEDWNIIIKKMEA